MAPSTEIARSRLAVRLVRIIRLLDGAAHCPRIDAMADLLRVSMRTIQRDLAALDEAGWRVPPRRTKGE